MPVENCLCGEPINIDAANMWSYGEKQIVIGCHACRYTGEKSKRKLGAVVINTSNDNGETNGS